MEEFFHGQFGVATIEFEASQTCSSDESVDAHMHLHAFPPATLLCSQSMARIDRQSHPEKVTAADESHISEGRWPAASDYSGQLCRLHRSKPPVATSPPLLPHLESPQFHDLHSILSAVLEHVDADVAGRSGVEFMEKSFFGGGL